MDARAFLAIVFLLWLIRTWVKWDLQEKNATQSRLRLRERLADSMLRERVGARHASPDAADVVSSGAVAESPDTVDDSVMAERRQRLQDQLAMLETQAKASRQSDLEIRRLRSELDSVPSDGTDISSLEERCRLQQEALAEGARNMSSQVVDEPVQNDEASQAQASELNASEHEQQTQPPPASEQTDDTSEGNKQKTPLFQAPSEKDDLKLIKGIGPVMERTLNELGVTTFRQLANFNQADIDKVSEAIGAFSGRIERDDWVGKAQKFVRDKSSA